MNDWFRRGPSDAEIREEIEGHLAMRAGHDGAGESAARRRFGSALSAQEQARDVWRDGLLDALRQDMHFALRGWRRNPGFAVSAIAALALGLGMSTALFSVVDRLLFRALPYPEPDSLVSVGLMAPLDSNEFLLGGDYSQLWREPPPPFEATTTMTAGAQPCDLTPAPGERLGCLYVEANFLDLLRVPVAVGRNFTRDDDKPGAPRVALISHGLWMRRFGGRADIAGLALILDGRQVPIAGVLGRGFELPLLNAADVLLPQQLGIVDPNRPGPMTFLRGFARLKRGITPQQALVSLAPLFEKMLGNVPAAFRKEVTLRVRPLRDRQVGDAKRAAWLLLGAVAMLLLIACTNVAGLLLARMAARERELAIRAALGAGRSRLARLVLAECLMLSLAGAALGVAFAHALLKVLVAMAPGGIPRIAEASVDSRVLAAALCFAVGSAALTALWPMLSTPRAEALTGARVAAAVRPRARLVFVSAQIGLTFALLGGASLLLRSLWNLERTPLGLDSAHVATMTVTLGPSRYQTPEQQVSFFERLLESAGKMPGTVSAALTDSVPPSGGVRTMIFARIDVEGRPPVAEGTGGMVPWRSVTPGYFNVLRVPIVRGRGFEESDRHSAEPALILSESLARKMFPNEDPLGRRLRPGSGNNPWHHVVGIARDVRNSGLMADSGPEYYVARQAGPRDGFRESTLIVRTQLAPPAVAGLLREVMARLDPELPFRQGTMQARVSRLTETPRFLAWLLAVFAGLALVLAAAGLAGVAAYLVAQRTREIGVRMALGATGAKVAATVLSEAGRWALAGTALGLALAAAAGRLIAAFLYEVKAYDPWAWLAAMGVLAAVMLLAVLRPAVRAARVDPMAALRE